jgi:hypothetical protein
MTTEATYTSTISYFESPHIKWQEPLRFSAADDSSFQAPEAGNLVVKRAKDIFTQAAYKYTAPALSLGKVDMKPPQGQELFVLRLLIKKPDTEFVMPEELGFLKDFVAETACYQATHFPDYADRFVYMTLRSGLVRSSNDDSFHADGFQGISVPRHIPEQNYIWMDRDPTLFAVQPYFVEHLDPARHDFHEYFNRCTDMANVQQAKAGEAYIMDPYHIHARPVLSADTWRSFVRICYSPVEIRDDTNTPNKWLPMGPYNREDIRNRLVPAPF